jgi:hypothetical protein
MERIVCCSQGASVSRTIMTTEVGGPEGGTQQFMRR